MFNFFLKKTFLDSFNGELFIYLWIMDQSTFAFSNGYIWHLFENKPKMQIIYITCYTRVPFGKNKFFLDSEISIPVTLEGAHFCVADKPK